MAWIESHQSLLTHRKTGRLARALGIPKVHAVGHLHAFWWWCLDNAADGQLIDSIPAEVADAACWEGDAELFMQAMVLAGFIDPDSDGVLHVHDWMDYAGRLVQKRDANAKRMKEARAKNRPNTCEHETINDDGMCSECAAHVQRTTGTRAAHVQGLPNPTVPNRTKPKRTNPDPAALGSKVEQSAEYLRQVLGADLGEYAAESIRAEGTTRDDPAAYFVKLVGMVKGQFKKAPPHVVVKSWQAARAKAAGIGYATSVINAEIKRLLDGGNHPANGTAVIDPVDALLSPEEMAALLKVKAQAAARHVSN